MPASFLCCDVTVPPAAPEDVDVVEDTPTTVVLGVTPSEEDGGVPIIGYQVAFDTIVTNFGLGKHTVVTSRCLYVFVLKIDRVSV